MRKLLLVVFPVLILTSCNDGDVLEIALAFDQELSLCGDLNSANGQITNENYVIYDTKNDPNESLTLLFPTGTTNNLIFNPASSPHITTFTINGNSIRFNYRTYDGNPLELICQEIPSSTVNIIDDFSASNGLVTATSTFVDDDNDGVSTLLEDINGNGNLEDDDTDGDGIPNYKDADDDGDNVLTKRENPDLNDDGNVDDAQDTDGDTIPDYLDDDDDGDGVITRYEDENLNGNLSDDFATNATVSRYLDNTAIDTFVYDTFNTNVFSRTITVEFIIENVDLEILNTDLIDLGTYTSTITFEN
jgi:hypothetical protein